MHVKSIPFKLCHVTSHCLSSLTQLMKTNWIALSSLSDTIAEILSRSRVRIECWFDTDHNLYWQKTNNCLLNTVTYAKQSAYKQAMTYKSSLSASVGQNLACVSTLASIKPLTEWTTLCSSRAQGGRRKTAKSIHSMKRIVLQ